MEVIKVIKEVEHVKVKHVEESMRKISLVLPKVSAEARKFPSHRNSDLSNALAKLRLEFSPDDVE